MAWTWLSQVCAHALSLTQCMVRGCIWRAQLYSDTGPLWRSWCHCSAWTSSRAMSQTHCPLQPQVHHGCSVAALICLLLPSFTHGHVSHLVLQPVTARMLLSHFQMSVCNRSLKTHSMWNQTHVSLYFSSRDCACMMATLPCLDTQIELGLACRAWAGLGMALLVGLSSRQDCCHRRCVCHTS